MQLDNGSLEATPADHRLLSFSELEAGWRMACQARVNRGAVYRVPALMRVPKAATMGVGRLVLLAPNVHKVYLELEKPSLHDQRSDCERLKYALLGRRIRR